MPGKKILFTDSDPLSVVQGQQLLAYTSDMAYAHLDVRDPDALIEQATAYFGAERRHAVGCIRILYFLSDDQLQALMTRLHAFCAPGSVMALSFHEVPDVPALREALLESAKLARIQFHVRTPEQIAALMGPWRDLTIQRLDEVLDRPLPPCSTPSTPCIRPRSSAPSPDTEALNSRCCSPGSPRASP